MLIGWTPKRSSRADARGQEPWTYQGILAFSKVCTHVVVRWHFTNSAHSTCCAHATNPHLILLMPAT